MQPPHKYAMRYLDLIRESRLAPLYHATGFFNAKMILEENAFRGRTEHILPWEGTEMVVGVSFTRDRRFATDWGYVVFEVDQERLAQRYSIIPFDYWHETRTRFSHPHEAEEFIVGDVRPADRYIIAIRMTQRGYDLLLKRNADTNGGFDVVVNHPKLKISV